MLADKSAKIFKGEVIVMNSNLSGEYSSTLEEEPDFLLDAINAELKRYSDELLSIGKIPILPPTQT